MFNRVFPKTKKRSTNSQHFRTEKETISNEIEFVLNGY